MLPEQRPVGVEHAARVVQRAGRRAPLRDAAADEDDFQLGRNLREHRHRFRLLVLVVVVVVVVRDPFPGPGAVRVGPAAGPTTGRGSYGLGVHRERVVAVRAVPHLGEDDERGSVLRGVLDGGARVRDVQPFVLADRELTERDLDLGRERRALVEARGRDGRGDPRARRRRRRRRRSGRERRRDAARGAIQALQPRREPAAPSMGHREESQRRGERRGGHRRALHRASGGVGGSSFFLRSKHHFCGRAKFVIAFLYKSA